MPNGDAFQIVIAGLALLPGVPGNAIYEMLVGVDRREKDVHLQFRRAIPLQPMSTFLTPREAAKVANVGLTTLYGALRRGELRHSRVPPGLRTIRMIVIVTPRADDRLGVRDRFEAIHVQAFVTQTAIETLDNAFSTGFPAG